MAARTHLQVDRAAIVLVGDADAFGPALEAAGVGKVVVERDDGPTTLGPIPEKLEVAVDEGEDAGPVVGATKPDVPGPSSGDDSSGSGPADDSSGRGSGSGG